MFFLSHIDYVRTAKGKLNCKIYNITIFRLDALALSVIAYSDVAGWVAVCHSRYCIKTTKRI